MSICFKLITILKNTNTFKIYKRLCNVAACDKMFHTENNYSGNLKAAVLESSEVCQVKIT